MREILEMFQPLWRFVLLTSVSANCLLLESNLVGMPIQLYAINRFTELDPNNPPFTRTVSQMHSVDPTTGESTFVAGLNGSGATIIEGIDFRDNGQLYGITQLGDLMTIDVNTGTVSYVGIQQGPGTPGRFPIVDHFWDVAFSQSNEPYIIGSNLSSGRRWLFKLDISDGTIVSEVEITTVEPSLPFIDTIDFTAGGVLYGGFDELSTIDISSGESTLVLPGSGGVNNGPTLAL